MAQIKFPMIHSLLFLERAWVCHFWKTWRQIVWTGELWGKIESDMVFTTPEKSWNLKGVLESPGILLKFWKSSGIFLWSNSLKERFLSKHQHFSGFLCMLNLAVHWLTAVIFIWGILNAMMPIYSQHITGWQHSNFQLRA